MTDATGTITPESVREGGEAKSPFRLPASLDNPTAAALLIALLTVIVYWRVLGFSFVNFDDDKNIFANPHMMPVNAKGIGYLWTHGYYELYMPVTYTIWAVCSYLFPLSQPVYVPGGGNAFVNPAAFHALSLILHTANSVLAFALLYRLTRRLWPACAGALLFSLHPVQVESVAWITGMNNLTSGFFSLLALLFYVAAAEGSAKTAVRGRLHYAAATFFFILALLSKPSVAGLPLVAAVLDWGVLGRPPARWLRALLPWVLLSLALAAITRITSETSQKLHLELWVRPFIAGDALAVHISKLFLPINVSINVGRSMYLVKSSWWGYVTWLFPALVAFLLWRAGKPARLLQTGALVFVAALLPMLGLVVYYTLAVTTVSVRYLYLSMLGAGLAVVWFLSNARISRGIRVGIFLTALILYTGQTLYQLPNWKNTYTLAGDQVKVNPADHSSQSNYAIALAEDGKTAEAIPHFRAAVALKPDNAIYQYHLGATLEDFGDISGAMAPLSESVRLDPKFALAQMRLGGVLLKLGQSDEAIKPLQKAVEISPNDSSAGYMLGIALAGAERYPEAEAQFRRILSIPNGIQQARQALGRVLEKQGRNKEAAQVYQEILKTTPEDAEAAKGLERTAKP